MRLSIWITTVPSSEILFYNAKKILQLTFSFVLSLQMVTRTKKIFVGGLSAPTTLEDVKSYFEQFGQVSNISCGKLF